MTLITPAHEQESLQALHRLQAPNSFYCTHPRLTHAIWECCSCLEGGKNPLCNKKNGWFSGFLSANIVLNILKWGCSERSNFFSWVFQRCPKIVITATRLSAGHSAVLTPLREWSTQHVVPFSSGRLLPLAWTRSAPSP